MSFKKSAVFLAVGGILLIILAIVGVVIVLTSSNSQSMDFTKYALMLAFPISFYSLSSSYYHLFIKK